MSGSMVEYQSFNQLGIKIVAVLHFHDFHHMEIDRRPECLFTCRIGRRSWWSNGEYGIDYIG
jgi:hypothetical protein